MVTQVTSPPTPPPLEAIFTDAFTSERQRRFDTLIDTAMAPNRACGDNMDPNFDGLYFWSNNVNTLSMKNDMADLHELCRQFQENNVGIAAMQELNIDMSQAHIYKSVKAVFEEHFTKHCTLICSTTHIRSSTTWKPGSTLLVILPEWAPYIVDCQRDELGRWCSVTLSTRQQKEIVFYSLYNCCKTKIEQAGIHTIFAQQWHVLRQRGDSAPDPRLQAITDLAAEITVHRKQARLICISGDCNEDIGVDPALMASICCSNDLVDVMDVLHPHASDVPSYARGPNRLDYALASLALVPYLEGAGLNFYHEYYPSDHRPIFIGLSRRLFGPLPPCSPH
jgi:hypothetical protein